ncbi:MAG TPA: DUF805 domain-containing protein [Gammaproteobacteria bacterium]|nr:DUF805 domain-containing protein [Gammaproteobacteria bacterium]
MTFVESIRMCLTKYADFNGVASRSEFWWFMLFVYVVTVVLNYVTPLLGGLFWLAMLVPSLAAGARRLHDTGKSAWLLLLWLVPLVGQIVLIVFWVQPPKS